MIEDLHGIASFVANVWSGVVFIMKYWIWFVIGIGVPIGLAYAAFLWKNRVLAIIAGCVAVVGLLLITAYTTGYQARKADFEKEAAAERERVLQMILEGKQIAIDELNKEKEDAEKRSAELDAILKEIQNAPKDQNGEVAPVLDNLLKRLDGVRASPKPTR